MLDTGLVVFCRWSTRGYGNLVIIDHGKGWADRYAHLSQIGVGCGGAVYQGQVIGAAGQKARNPSTGSHLTSRCAATSTAG